METYLSERMLLYAEIMYGTAIHYITLRNYQGELEWTLAPYNGSYFITNGVLPDSFLIVLQAIHDHSEIHKKSSILGAFLYHKVGIGCTEGSLPALNLHN